MILNGTGLYAIHILETKCTHFICMQLAFPNIVLYCLQFIHIFEKDIDGTILRNVL